MSNAAGLALASYLSGRNRIINGDHRVAQYGGLGLAGTAGTLVVGYGGPDRFRVANVAGGTCAQTTNTMLIPGRNAAVPCVLQSAQVVATNNSGTNYWGGIGQIIEGNNIFDILGLPMCLSFWMSATLPGLYSVAVRDGATARSFVTTVNILAANTPQQVIIPIPANSSLLISSMSGNGFFLNIGAVQADGGSYVTTTLNQWVSGNFITTNGTVKWNTTLNAGIAVAELQLEPYGPTPFERVDITDSILRCYRYFQKFGYQTATAPGTANVDGGQSMCIWSGFSADTNSYLAMDYNYAVEMRTNPNCILYNPRTGATGSMWAQNAGASLTAGFGNFTARHAQATLLNQSVQARDVIKFCSTHSAEL